MDHVYAFFSRLMRRISPKEHPEIQEIDSTVYDKIVSETEHCEPGFLKKGESSVVKTFDYRGSIKSLSKITTFVENAELLRSLGFTNLEVTEAYYDSDRSRGLVIYNFINGKSLRQLATEHSFDWSQTLIGLLVDLHQSGIFFRAIHLGNILIDDQNNLNLIDFSDLTKLGNPLSPNLSARNMAHLIRNRDDRVLYYKSGFRKLRQKYQLTRYGEKDHKAFSTYLYRHLQS